MWRVLDWNLQDSGGNLRVVVGDCPTGVDRFVVLWCRQRRVAYRVYSANWSAFGSAAGPKRNREMIDTERPDKVLAFLHPASKGAMGCARYARKQGYQVEEIWA